MCRTASPTSKRAVVSPVRVRGNGAPYLHRTWRYLELQFHGEVTQTRMLRWCPHWLLVDYTRTMLAALLLQPRPRRIGIIGLGGGAQAKFCHRHLPAAQIEVVESDARVLALRDAFHIPADNPRFHIEHGDGALWLRDKPGRFDLLLVDAYDARGIPAALASEVFHRDCHAALSDTGVLASNLYDTDVERHLRRMRHAFDGQLCTLDEPGMENVVAFGWRGNPGVADAGRALAALPWPARCQLGASMRRLARELSAAR